ncbi:hypothetical protein D3C87_1431390 [compost metagenome]
MHALFQSAFATGVDATEQQMFEQVRQLFFRTVEIVDADADDQPDRHMPALGTGLKQNLQAVAQGVTLDLKAIQGKRRE